MASNKPATSTLPRWADGGAALVTEPSSGKKDVGWAVNEQPPPQWFNWLLYKIYLWFKWLDDGPYLQREDEASRVPMLAFADADGNVSQFVDAAGYLGGNAVQIQHTIIPTLSVTPGGAEAPASNQGLVGHASTNTTLTTDTTIIDSGFDRWVLEVGSGATAASAASRLYPGQSMGAINAIGGLADTVASFECSAYLSAVGSNGVDAAFGFHADPDGTLTDFHDPTARIFAMFKKESTDTNWRCVVGDAAAGTNNDSTVTPVADTWETFRVEYYGANTPVGVANGFATVRFYIDGTLVSEITDANVPSGSFYLVPFVRFAADGTGPGTSRKLNIANGMRSSHNFDLSTYAPA